MLKRTKRIATFTSIVFFSLLLIAGCADFFAPGLREATETLTANVEEVAAEQGGITTLINDGQAALQGLIDETRANMETLTFRTEADRIGSEAMLASLETSVGEAHDAATAITAGFDAKVNQLVEESQAVADRLADADTPGAALSVFGELLIPFLGPYAPVAEIGLSLLGLGGAGRAVNKRAKKNGATSVLAPIEKARNLDLEAKLTADDPAGRQFIVFDTLLTKPVFDANGAGAIIDSFRGLAEKKAA